MRRRTLDVDSYFRFGEAFPAICSRSVSVISARVPAMSLALLGRCCIIYSPIARNSPHVATLQNILTFNRLERLLTIGLNPQHDP